VTAQKLSINMQSGSLVAREGLVVLFRVVLRRVKAVDSLQTKQNVNI